VPPLPPTILDGRNIRDLSEAVLEAPGRPKILPASFWASTTQDERCLVGHLHGIYLFPTVELVDRLRELIAGRHAIEVGAGNGALAAALGIPATDSLQQEKEPWKTFYAETRQPTVTYGADVVEMHASRAVRTYKPDVVIGAWITSKGNKPGTNPVGVDELDVLRHCETLILIGDEKVHADKQLWGRRHNIEHPPYIYSRSRTGGRQFIAVWDGSARWR
jgi:hypothetical protein